MSMKFLPKAASALAILGVASGVANAQTTFNVTSAVQNALTVVSDADMNLGTLFATTAASSSYKYVVLSPAGAFAAPAGHADITLLTLGGQSAARGSVAVGNTTAFTVELPAASVTTGANSTQLNSSGIGGTDIAADVLGGVEIRVADPGVARFYLVNFRAGAASGGSTGANCASTNSCTLTPSFGSTSVSFGIGATVVTDLSTLRTAYESDPGYSGSFEVTATY